MQESKDGWVVCQSTTLTVFRPGGGDYPRPADHLTLGRKYRLVDTDSPQDNRYVTVINDLGRPQVYRDYLFEACDPPSPEELPAETGAAGIDPKYDGLLTRVCEAWGDAERVYEVCINALCDDGLRLRYGEDYDDQVSDAKDLGILAGRYESKTPEAFLVAFLEKFKKDEDENED